MMFWVGPLGRERISFHSEMASEAILYGFEPICVVNN